MTYQAPVADIAFALKHGAGFKRVLADGIFGDLGEDVVDAVLAEAGRFASEVIAPLNRVGDHAGVVLEDGALTTPPGWKDAYAAWTAAGWNGVAAPEQWGGQGLPQALNFACLEMWNAAALSFGLAPLLTMGTIDALSLHGSETLQRTYLPKLVSGEWTGTMQLTEPQAGSDLGALRTRAERMADGSYRLTGQKIFITYGEHDLAANIVHLVLARLPDAPAGTRGLSLFVVPKFLPDRDGAPGARNDIRAHSIEHKLGIHGAPTCTMVLGDHGGATGFLVGEENRGLNCMFTMMNQARLSVGLQGVGIAERAYQQALAYARERRQGHASALGSARDRARATAAPDDADDGMSPIIAHPDVKRMLLTMRSLTAAARAICYATAVAIDRAHRSADDDARRTADERAALLTPVAKAFATDVGCEVASLGIQVHGGMGFVEETGAAQHFRDARILPIYEGTNGIQAIDLVTRKLPVRNGASVRAYIAELRATADAVTAANDPAFGATGARLGDAIDSLARATDWLIGKGQGTDALAGATPYLRLFAHAAGGALLAEQALAASRGTGSDDGAAAARVALARFFAENVAVMASGLERTVIEGADSVNASEAALTL